MVFSSFLCLSLHSHANLIIVKQTVVDKEIAEMERVEERERVPVPVRRRELVVKKELQERLPEPLSVEVREMPRRWRVY